VNNKNEKVLFQNGNNKNEKVLFRSGNNKKQKVLFRSGKKIVVSIPACHVGDPSSFPGSDTKMLGAYKVSFRTPNRLTLIINPGKSFCFKSVHNM